MGVADIRIFYAIPQFGDFRNTKRPAWIEHILMERTVYIWFLQAEAKTTLEIKKC